MSRAADVRKHFESSLTERDRDMSYILDSFEQSFKSIEDILRSSYIHPYDLHSLSMTWFLLTKYGMLGRLTDYYVVNYPVTQDQLYQLVSHKVSSVGLPIKIALY